VPVPMKKTAYNKMMEDLFTIDGKQYGVAQGIGGDSWQGNFVFWNKRLLKEAGIDPDLPYDLQKANNWTWDTFYDMLKKTTRDINNDGITDIYGLPCDDVRQVVYSFVYGNNAQFVSVDNEGVLHNTTNSPGFIEALQFYQKLLQEGLMKMRPRDAAWDWDFTDFIDGKVAFIIAPEWRKGELPEMKDDYGSVLPARGPRANDIRMSLTETVWVIPAYFSPEEVDVTLTALDLWYVPVTDDWKLEHYTYYRDRRAVDETVAMTKDGKHVVYRDFEMVPDYNVDAFLWDLPLFTGSAAQLVEQNKPRIDAILEDFNGF